MVVRHQHGTAACGVFQLLGIGRANKSGIGCGRCFDSPLPQAVGDGVIHALVQVKLELHCLASLGQPAQTAKFLIRIPDLVVDLLQVVVVVRQRAVDLAERQMR